MPQMFLPIFPTETTYLNEKVGFVKSEGRVYYFLGAMPIFFHQEDDMQSFRFITSQLVLNGSATQAQIVRAFGISSISMKRYVKKLREKGLSGFSESPRKRSTTILTPEVMNNAQELLDAGVTIRDVADRLQIKECTIRKAVDQGRLRRIKKKKRQSK